MDKKSGKKVPFAVVVLIIVIVAVIAFVPLVYSPYKSKKPAMDAKHEEAVAQIQAYDDAIADQANIEKSIAELQAEWDQFNKDMFVDAGSSLADLNAVCQEKDINLKAFKQGNATQDPSESYSYTGSPLYYVTINISLITDRETLLELLDYIEVESIGCYYIKKLSAKTKTGTSKDGEYEEGDLEVSMDVYLYYYNQDITVDLDALAAVEESKAK